MSRASRQKEKALQRLADRAAKDKRRSTGVVLQDGSHLLYQPREAKHDRSRSKKGQRLDEPLPHGTVVVVPGAAGTYYPDGTIVVPSRSRRVVAHEKGHYIWDRRMTATQKREFARVVKPAIRELTGKSWRRLNREHRKEGRDYAVEDELFAIYYAGYKEGRGFARPVARFFRRLLR